DVGRVSSAAAPEANVVITGNILGLDKTGTKSVDPSTPNGALPLGNVLDGVLLDNVVWVVIGGGTGAGGRDIFSPNPGRGIEIRGDHLPGGPSPAYNNQANVIQGNYVGTDISGNNAVYVFNQPGNPAIRTFNLGNLSDGIFLLNPTLTQLGGLAPGQ